MTVAIAFSKRLAGLTAAAGAALALGCGGDESGPGATSTAPTTSAPTAPAAQPVKADATADAKFIFDTRCFTCHGPMGAGDGPGSKALTPPPRNFQDAAWQDEVNDEHIANIIMYGGAAVGRSPTMPGNPDLSGKPEVVSALVALLRGLRSE